MSDCEKPDYDGKRNCKRKINDLEESNVKLIEESSTLPGGFMNVQKWDLQSKCPFFKRFWKFTVPDIHSLDEKIVRSSLGNAAPGTFDRQVRLLLRKRGYLEITISFEENEQPLPLFAYGEMTVSLVRHRSEQRPVTQTVGTDSPHLFFELKRFVSWRQLVSERGRFIKNGSITLHVHFSCLKAIPHYMTPQPSYVRCTPVASSRTTPKSSKIRKLQDDTENNKVEDTDEEQDSLDKQNYRSLQFLETGLGADCEFLVGSERQSFKASKAILAIGSPYFEAMFFGGLAEHRSPIPMPSIDPDSFSVLLKALYGCKYSLCGLEQVLCVFDAADMCACDELVKRCLEMIWPSTVDNKFWAALHLATRRSRNDLLEAVMRIVRVETQKVFESKEFLNISQESLVSILKQHEMKVKSEVEVLNATLRWATHNCDRKENVATGKSLREVLGDAILHVRFLSMSQTEFAGEPRRCGLLSSYEQFAINSFYTRGLSTGQSAFTLCPFIMQRGQKGPIFQSTVCRPRRN